MGAFPHYIKGMARTALGSEWGKRSAANYKPTEDWHTQELRALHDAKGVVLRKGVTYTADKITHWQTRRSIEGRVDQLDLVANGQVVRTAGPRRLPRRFRPDLIPSPSTPAAASASH